MIMLVTAQNNANIKPQAYSKSPLLNISDLQETFFAATLEAALSKRTYSQRSILKLST